MVAVAPLRVPVLVLALLCTSPIRFLVAQNNAPAPSRQNAEISEKQDGDIVFKATVRRVIVDVAVTGSDGKPASGLKASDFSVAEDGKPQKVLSFDVHDFDPVSDSLPKRPNLPANTFINLPSGPERGPLYVLLLDLLNMDVDDQPAARKQLYEFALSKPLGTRFAVFVLSDGLHVVQGFTEDRNLLASALDPKSPRSHLPRIFLYADNFRPFYSVPRVLIGLARYVGDLPGRKNIIWFSGSFPSSLLPTGGKDAEAENFHKEIKEATDAMARGQISVYPVDSHGVTVTGAGAGPQGRNIGNSRVMSSNGMSTPDPNASTGLGGGNPADFALNARYMTEDELAYATGGRAFHSTNNLVSALTEVTEAGGHYYTLTYAPTNQDYSAQQRNIHVELAKRGYSLAYRRVYYGSPSFVEPGSSGTKSASTEMAAIRQEADSLNAHMKLGAPIVHQLLFRVHVRPLGRPARASPEQMAKLADAPASSAVSGKTGQAKSRRPIDLQTYEIDYAIAARKKALEVAATAFGDDGSALNGVVQRVDDEDSQFVDEESHEGIFRIRQQIDVPTTAVSIRIGVRDLKTDNVGALEVRLPLAPEGPTADASMHPSALQSQAEDR